MSRFLRRGDLSKELQISWPTIKYYTKVGLFPIARKTPHGQYLYDVEEVRSLYEKIKEMKRKRHTIEEMLDRLVLERL